MAKQNIYDNETFFEGYKKIRENKANANVLFEMPALFSLLPDLQGKKVIDLGCGFGEHCMKYVCDGATKVVGIDISEKMLEVAKRENNNSRITYLNMPMENLSEINEKFDVAISSLALHYIVDFDTLAKNVYEMLHENGVFVFSQEHPINTCFSGEDRWTRDERGNKLYANLANYSLEGERESKWFVDGVKKYHRTFSGIVNSLVKAGFTIEQMIEPIPTPELLEKYPEQVDLYHKPDFLLVKVRK